MEKLSSNLAINIEKLKNEYYNDCSDFLLKEVTVNGEKAFFAAMDGLINSLMFTQMVARPILTCELDFKSPQEHYEKIKSCVISSVEVNEAQSFEDFGYFLMSGFAVFMIDGYNKAICLGAQGWNKRNTDEPSNEAMVKGAKECFIEALNDNKALLRKRLKTHHLKFKQLKLGKDAKTPVVLAYLDNRADKALLSQIEMRLKGSNLQAVLDYGCLLPFIDTDIKTFFSAVGTTERPDTLASKLLEGRVAVMIEGTPFAMYVPYLFSDNFQVLDDYDNPPFYAGFIRLLKYFSFVVSVFLPAFYVAIGTYHQELLPTNLLFTIVHAEVTTPFPLTIEALLIHLLYEIMREAGLRLPKTIGHAVSIIGALVIGEATVTAGLIGAPMLIVVAVTAIASYVVYPLYESAAILRIGLIVIAGITGIYGVVLAAACLCVNIAAINPYGIPYTAPISPLNKKSIGDIIFRESWKKLSRRRVRVQEMSGVSIDE